MKTYFKKRIDIKKLLINRIKIKTYERNCCFSQNAYKISYGKWNLSPLDFCMYIRGTNKKKKIFFPSI